MSLEYKLIFIAFCAVLFFSGWLIGKLGSNSDGIIRIESNQDGSRDVIRFILDLDLDDIRSKKQLKFKVEDLSQNSQPRK